MLENQRALVLNKSWTPIQTISMKRAVTLVFAEKARIIDPNANFQTYSWDEWAELKPTEDEDFIKAANDIYRAPLVILLLDYNKYPERTVNFSRRNIYRRDGFTCQFCGDKPGTERLNIDHVIPRSQGGKTSWENCVISCISCNTKKSNRTPEQCGMKLLKKPEKPRWIHMRGGTKKIKEWEFFLGENFWAYELGE